jgi:hypothetical protein
MWSMAVASRTPPPKQRSSEVVTVCLLPLPFFSIPSTLLPLDHNKFFKCSNFLLYEAHKYTVQKK